MISWEEAIYYRKVVDPAITRDARPFDAPSPQAQEKSWEEILEDLSRHQVAADLNTERKTAVIAPEKQEEILVQATRAFHLKRDDDALRAIDKALALDKNSFEAHYLAAQIFVNRGNFPEAKKRLELLLGLDPLYSAAQYLLGCIHTQEGVLGLAKECLKKALYLDRNFPLARFQLATVYRNSGQADDAIREYRNTLKILMGVSGSDIIAHSGGLSVMALVGICRDNLERLKEGQ
ncbi:MAG: tetratricopeptide repeat protein [Candidatus Omnitrophica bacterium]|nr:tetratricopeptide repeat protein [Candidatus Omnitrophota bacterium]